MQMSATIKGSIALSPLATPEIVAVVREGVLLEGAEADGTLRIEVVGGGHEASPASEVGLVAVDELLDRQSGSRQKGEAC